MAYAAECDWLRSGYQTLSTKHKQYKDIFGDEGFTKESKKGLLSTTHWTVLGDDTLSSVILLFMVFIVSV